ncbi:hypothetical protein LTR91_001361 [Friedmanniomyces endolithicus]|uniref:Uncharacterized protein n=1 Tax=Friedmanniomyces endolithicus TaxID=329885 RepID=A0AAN6L165_9PEZI|nr:hypothetical protein LTR57_002520 [Friedmanniomyces endolithicus]KAK0979406.1 hypothetical protein LTS01_012373 [Friedmanniomyces endolithicus]KAK1013764.1 hypothetical protein LTR91_001361 [Friedmanniomyces endolithicus]KAK1036424.1 hypothetical protein LTS16_013715 [Friedmanniomyces endolithicus]
MAALVIVASLALADKLEKKKQARRDRKAAVSELRVHDLRAEMRESKGGTAATTATGATGGTATSATSASGKRRDSGREWWESDDGDEEGGTGAGSQAQQRGAREEQVRAPPPPLEYEKKADAGAGGKRSRLLRAW